MHSFLTTIETFHARRSTATMIRHFTSLHYHLFYYVDSSIFVIHKFVTCHLFHLSYCRALYSDIVLIGWFAKIPANQGSSPSPNQGFYNPCTIQQQLECVVFCDNSSMLLPRVMIHYLERKHEYLFKLCPHRVRAFITPPQLPITPWIALVEYLD